MLEAAVCYASAALHALTAERCYDAARDVYYYGCVGIAPLVAEAEAAADERKSRKDCKKKNGGEKWNHDEEEMRMKEGTAINTKTPPPNKSNNTTNAATAAIAVGSATSSVRNALNRLCAAAELTAPGEVGWTDAFRSHSDERRRLLSPTDAAASFRPALAAGILATRQGEGAAAASGDDDVFGDTGVPPPYGSSFSFVCGWGRSAGGGPFALVRLHRQQQRLAAERLRRIKKNGAANTNNAFSGKEDCATFASTAHSTSPAATEATTANGDDENDGDFFGLSATDAATHWLSVDGKQRSADHRADRDGDGGGDDAEDDDDEADANGGGDEKNGTDTEERSQKLLVAEASAAPADGGGLSPSGPSLCVIRVRRPERYSSTVVDVSSAATTTNVSGGVLALPHPLSSSVLENTTQRRFLTRTQTSLRECPAARF